MAHWIVVIWTVQLMTWIFGSAFAKFLIWLLLSAGDGDFIACSCFVKSAFDNSLWDILIKAMFEVSYLKEKEELNMYKQQDTFFAQDWFWKSQECDSENRNEYCSYKFRRCFPFSLLFFLHKDIFRFRTGSSVILMKNLHKTLHKELCNITC